MRRVVLCSVLPGIFAGLVLVSPARAQGIPADVQTHLKAGRYAEALDSLAGQPASETVLRLRFDTALKLPRFDTAMTSLQELERTTRKPRPDLLGALAVAVVTDIERTDAAFGLEACEALMDRGERECAERLATRAKDEKLPIAARLLALAALARHGHTRAGTDFRRLADRLSGRDQRTAVQAAIGLPPAIALDILKAGLKNSEGDVQASAAWALGEVALPDSRLALRQFLAGTPHWAARFPARLGLAALGDAESLEQLAQQISTLQGSALLAAGEALTKAGSPRGAAALKKALTDDNQVVRLKAAATLSPKEASAAMPVLRAGLDDSSPLVRAEAFKAFRSSPLLTLETITPALLDPNAIVRLRAGEAVLARTHGAATEPAAQSRRRR